jgi:hypothetical protein
LPDGIAVGVLAPAAAEPEGQAAVLARALVVDAPPDVLLPPEEQAAKVSPAAMATVTAALPLRRTVRAFSSRMAASPADI